MICNVTLSKKYVGIMLIVTGSFKGCIDLKIARRSNSLF